MEFDSININNKTSRRKVLDLGWRSAAAAIALGGAKLQAVTATGGRIVVHLQLSGGADSNNMIIPLDDAPYARYSKARGLLAIPRAQALPIKASRQGLARFGFHPALVQLQALYNRNSLAVVAGVGPTSRAAASHTSTELVYIKGGYSSAAWAAGLLGITDPLRLAERAITFPSGTTLLSASLATKPSSAAVERAMGSANIVSAFPDTKLGRNMKQVAQLIRASSSLGAVNPFLFTGRSGFDTHVDELAAQSVSLSELDSALGAFQRAMEDAGLARQVTLYTETEFNRTLVPNSNNGSEHGWAGHNLVMGNSVQGGDIYGTFPSMTVGGADDADGKGSWIPSTSNDQYHYTMARWQGVGLDRVPAVFPRLSPAADLRFVV